MPAGRIVATLPPCPDTIGTLLRVTAPCLPSLQHIATRNGQLLLHYGALHRTVHSEIEGRILADAVEPDPRSGIAIPDPERHKPHVKAAASAY